MIYDVVVIQLEGEVVALLTENLIASVLAGTVGRKTHKQARSNNPEDWFGDGHLGASLRLLNRSCSGYWPYSLHDSMTLSVYHSYTFVEIHCEECHVEIFWGVLINMYMSL